MPTLSPPVPADLISRLREVSSQCLFIVLLSAIPALGAFVDLVDLGYMLPEGSITETFQTLILFVVLSMLWTGAKEHPGHRGAFLLMFGFYGCMLIRENDYFFDQIHHGSWIYPVIFLASGTILHVWRRERGTVIGPLLQLAESRAWPFVLVGLALILVMSRLFGSGRFLWSHVLQGPARFDLKTAIQEGMEMYGYLLTAYGLEKYLLSIPKLSPEKT